MFPVVPFVVVAYLALYAFAFSIPLDLSSTQGPLLSREQTAWLAKEKADLGPQSSFEAWIEEEETIALDKLLSNIAPGGANAKEAAPGSVIASPSKEHPNYFYQCKHECWQQSCI
jgi:glucoamylase